MIEIMVLGTFHFVNNGVHLHESDVSIREDEVLDVVQALSKFNPSKIAVESSIKTDKILNDKYKDYLSGLVTLNQNEINQIAFRLGKLQGHDSLYSVDWNEELKESIGFGDVLDLNKDIKSDLVDDLISDAKKHSAEKTQLVIESSIGEALKFYNTEENILKQSWLNDRLILLNNKNDYIGNRWLMYWHFRNLNIVSNVLNIAKEGDRILLMYGASHTKMLKELLNQIPNVILVDPLEFL